MLFNSYEFLFAFLPVVLIGWWGIRIPAARLAFLAASSYVFYAYWDWRFLPPACRLDERGLRRGAR